MRRLGADRGFETVFHVKRFLVALLLAFLPCAAFAQMQSWSPIPPVVTSSAVSNLVVKSACDPMAGCRLFDFQVTNTVSGYVLVFDAASAPVDGAVTPVKCYQVGAGTTGVSFPNPPLKFSTGIVLVMSTTGCFTKTASATAFFSAEAF